jgi:hypothetical protein
MEYGRLVASVLAGANVPLPSDKSTVTVQLGLVTVSLELLIKVMTGPEVLKTRSALPSPFTSMATIEFPPRPG